MQESTIAITILWSFLFVYSMLGSMDFGAGFWGMVYGNRATNASVIANRFLSPTWEVTNVFLVLFVVAMVSFFPFATSTLGAILLVPLSFGLILLTIRTTFMVFAHSAEKYRNTLRIISGVTGLLIPAFLVSILPITLGGFIENQDQQLHLLYGKFLTSPTAYFHIAFGLCTELFLSSLFLADYAKESKDWSAVAIYRKQAIWLGPITIIVALLTLNTLNEDAQWFLTNVEDQLYGFSLSFIMFIAGYSCLFFKNQYGKRGLLRYAVVFIILQYGFAIYAYGSAHLPYLVYPNLTVEQGFTNSTMFHSLLVGYSIGLCILVPAFYLFWRLFLKDRRYLNP